MATHIDDVDGSGIEPVGKSSFYQKLQWGDLVFCCGQEPMSKEIERITRSPFSHVLMAWLPGAATQWLTLEATFNRGVHVGKLSDYVDSYDGDLVMARRPALTSSDKTAALNAGFSVLEDAYDWRQEVSIAAHKLIHALPIEIPRREYYCSGLQYFMSLATTYPLRRPGLNYPTPEDLWVDPTVTPVCAMRNPAQSGSVAA